MHEVSDNEQDRRRDMINVMRGIKRRRKTREWMLGRVPEFWGASCNPSDFVGWMRHQLKRDLNDRMLTRNGWKHHLISMRPVGWYASRAELYKRF